MKTLRLRAIVQSSLVILFIGNFCQGAEPTVSIDSTDDLQLVSATAGYSSVETPVRDPYWDAIDGDPTSSHFLHTDTPLFTEQLNFQNRQTDKELSIMRNGNKWGDKTHVLVGFQARFSTIAAHTNRSGKFSYLTRFPTDFTGEHATDARLLHANAAVTGHVNESVHLYGELLFSDVFTFPSFNQGSLQVRQLYAVFGDLEASPFYAFIGKKNINFGDMGTLSPFSQSVIWHYFAALHESIGVGYEQEGLNVTLAAINGGRGIRVADSEDKGDLNNFAANGRYTIEYSEDAVLQFGAGFLYGTIYDATVAEHLDPTAFGDHNSAWDVNAQLQLGDWTFAGEFVTTVDDWPATGHPVVGYRTEAAYSSQIGSIPTRYSVSWSEGRQEAPTTSSNTIAQLVIGAGMELSPNALLTLEYVRSFGFAPLINITTVSDKSVKQDSIVGGLTLVL